MNIWLWLVLAVLVVAVIGLWYGLAGRQRQQVEETKELLGPNLGGGGVPEAPEEVWREGEEGWVDDAEEVSRRNNAQFQAPPQHSEVPQPELNVSFEGVQGADKFGPAVLAAGAHVIFEGTRYLVAGTGALKVGGLDTEGKADPDQPEPRIWYEHMLQGGTGSRWISVEDIEGRIRLGWWENRPDLTVDETDTEVSADGVTYRRGDAGDALFAVSGLSGAVTQGQYFFTDFHADEAVEASAHPLLRLETWGVEAKPGASLGRYISHDQLVVEAPQPEA